MTQPVRKKKEKHHIDLKRLSAPRGRLRPVPQVRPDHCHLPARGTLARQLPIRPAREAATGVEFVTIQPGEFMMGCSSGDDKCTDSEKPAHRVRITKRFDLGRYEVMQAQWESVMGSNPSDFKTADRPVEHVNRDDVREFLQKLNAHGEGYRYRL